MTTKLRIILVAVLITVPIDQLSKYWVDSHLPIGVRQPVIDGFFYLVHARNSGAVFGLFQDSPREWRLALFGAVSVAATIVVASFYRRLAPGEKLLSVALGLIVGGAIGNFTDRFVRGEVIDFLHVRLWGGFVWPDFNFADVFILLGVAALMLELISSEGSSRAEPDANHIDDSDANIDS